ncbi:MAG: hypothetical protein H6751_00525 [Candidatus Omnitrophica bacterium]|nr:hypothetical protein [Candidatus Omnitrophota bacterium]
MKKEDLAFVGCRLIAIFWGFKALSILSHSAQAWFALGTNPFPPERYSIAVMASVVQVALIAVSALFLWFQADLMVKLILPESPDDESSSEFTLHQIQTVVFAAVGLFILVSAIPELAGVFIPRTNLWVILLGLLVKCGLGLFLLLKADQISGRVSRLPQAE